MADAPTSRAASGRTGPATVCVASRLAESGGCMATDSEFALRTRRRVHAATFVVLLPTLLVVIVRGVRTNAMYSMVLASLWLMVVALGTFKNLRRLEALQAENPEPTPAMRQLSHLTVMLPILGTIPLSFGM